MAIRFQCAACSQPIEVDDEWAMKLVACPYCRRTVTAPRESLLDELSQVPSARPSGHAFGTSAEALPNLPSEYPYSPNVLRTAAAPAVNRVATAAVVLASLAILFVFAYFLAARPHRDEINELGRAVQTGGFKEVMRIQQEWIEQQGGLPGWVIAMTFFQLCSGACWLAGVICGLLGLRRHYERKERAIIALVMCGLVPVLYCCSGVALNV